LVSFKQQQKLNRLPLIIADVFTKNYLMTIILTEFNNSTNRKSKTF